MNSEELRRRATAMGVTASYVGNDGREAVVPDQTLAAILEVLRDAPPPGEPHRGATPLAVPAPSRRSWGFAVQLYSLRSRDSWGHGDLRDLAEFAAWSARDLGAGFVLINPLHAAEPVPPVSTSPYLPMSRRFISPLYLRIEDIEEYHDLDPTERAGVTALSKPLRDTSATSALIDRDAVWAAKRAALEKIRRVPLSPARQASLDAFRRQKGPALEDWATWCVIAERHGPDYRAWPSRLRHRESAGVAALRRELAGRAGFHIWAQWLVAEQAAAAQQAARAAGMGIGVIHDLAVGAHPGGADAWAGHDVFVRGVSVGAPPDAFNQNGQNWSLPPWHPGHLAAQGYRPLADLIAAAAGDAGGLRIDHAMGLSRLWWIPDGMPAAQGAYVRYDHEATLGALAAEMSRTGTIPIGEDLGTVEPWLRDALAERGVLGTSVLWFESEPDGTPRRPSHWRRNSLATVATHDMPPAAAFLSGEQVTERARLGLLRRSVAAEHADSDKLVAGWLAALAREGLIRAGDEPDAAAFTIALYGYLARTRALLISVSLAEAAGERRAQNMPGTSTEYPNWRVPLCGPDGAPVLLEDLPGNATVRAVAQAAAWAGPSAAGAELLLVARPVPVRDRVEREHVRVGLGLGVLLGYPGTELDMLADCPAEWLVVGQARLVERRHVQVDEPLALLVGDGRQAAVNLDDVVEAQLTGEAVGTAEGLASEPGQVLDMRRDALGELLLQHRVGEGHLVEDLLEPVQAGLTAGVLVKGFCHLAPPS